MQTTWSTRTTPVRDLRHLWKRGGGALRRVSQCGRNPTQPLRQGVSHQTKQSGLKSEVVSSVAGPTWALKQRSGGRAEYCSLDSRILGCSEFQDRDAQVAGDLMTARIQFCVLLSFALLAPGTAVGLRGSERRRPWYRPLRQYPLLHRRFI